MNMTSELAVFAGKRALAVIRERGLRSEDIRVIAGAAGGPKWLVLGHLDRLLFSSWIKPRREPLFLLGASIGAWRFAALSQKAPIQALERFEDAYIHQTYNQRPSAAEVSRESARILSEYLREASIPEILDHPFLRLNVMTVRCRPPVDADRKARLLVGLGMAAMANGIHRNLIGLFFERCLFSHPGTRPPFWSGNHVSLQRVGLTERNIRPALMASGAIPLVMEGITDIPGALPGMYRDGGIVDYHLDVPFLEGDAGLVLYPHYMPRIIPGWFDKQMKWRKPSQENMAGVVMISPSEEFIHRLPLRKIPDRNDFWLFEKRDAERIAYWKTVVSESRRLADAFAEATATGRIREMVRPL
ncbi:MAG: patatin-like phospholipase family protein [Thermodesulfobacteriota bacterium]